MMAAIPMEPFFAAMLGTLIAVVSAVQALGAMVVNPSRRKTYWRLLGLAHLPFLGAVGAFVWPHLGYALVPAGFFAGVIAGGILVRRTGWTRIGPCSLLFPLANVYTGLMATVMVVSWTDALYPA
jgi:hypothetical protein